MDDMDEMRTAAGTAADFSNWNVKNNFGTIKKKIVTKETVEEPVEENKQEEFSFDDKKEIPASINVNINSLAEIKELAKNLLPTVDRVKQEEFELASELAIDFAMTFEAIWQNKIRG